MLLTCKSKHLLALWLLSPFAALAAAHPCSEQADPNGRLACYDRAFPPLAAASASVPARSEAERLKEFGLTARALEEAKPEAERDAPIDQIEAVVTMVRGIQGGQRVLTLDNGQVWQITEGGTRGFLKPDDRVVIRRALMGSHILSTPGGLGLRARRVN